MTEPQVSLDHAHDYLIDKIGSFHTLMKTAGCQEMTLSEWIETFRSWLSTSEEQEVAL